MNKCHIQIYFSRWSKPCKKLSWYGGLVKKFIMKTDNVIMSLNVCYIALHMYHQIIVKSNTVMSTLYGHLSEKVAYERGCLTWGGNLVIFYYLVTFEIWHLVGGTLQEGNYCSFKLNGFNDFSLQYMSSLGCIKLETTTNWPNVYFELSWKRLINVWDKEIQLYQYKITYNKAEIWCIQEFKF
jgi:hypothetical protein